MHTRTTLVNYEQPSSLSNGHGILTGHGIDDNREYAQWWRSAFNLLDHLAGRKNYSKLKLEFKAVYSGSV